MKGRAVRFGEVLFDPVRRRLWVAGKPFALDRSSAAILGALVEQAGDEVGKDRLLEAGWPGRVVHENSLAKAVGRLRRALGDNAEALQTVHGYGYRLAVEPEEVPAATGKVAWSARFGWRAAALAVASAALLAWVPSLYDEPSEAGSPHLVKGEPADAIGRVLWVDDHPQNNASERAFLERNRIAVYQVVTTEEALQLLAMYEYDAVISDMNRNDKPLDGLALVKAMRQRKDPTPFVLYTVVPSAAQRELLAQAGGQAAAVSPQELFAAIVPLVRQRNASRARS